MFINPLVSIIIPTKNSAQFLETTLKSIAHQRYRPIEIIIVDSKSTDIMPSLAVKYHAKVVQLPVDCPDNTFDAPFKRNYGVKLAKGKYIYCVDADMELSFGLIYEAVRLFKKGFDALIVPEDSFGEGIWARAKQLQRRCYWGDDLIESPRFFRKSAWNAVGGVDETLVSGRDDGDLHQKLLEQKFRVGRTKGIVLHNEGRLTLRKQFLKKIMYGRDVISYIKKRPLTGILSYSPIRLGYFKNWRLFLQRPNDLLAFFILKTVEDFGGIVGIFISVFNRIKNNV